MERTNVSHQLKLLRQRGFVTTRREGKKRIYTLNSETVKPILQLAREHMKRNCKNRKRRADNCPLNDQTDL